MTVRMPFWFAALLAFLAVSLLLTARESLLGYFHLPWGGRQMLPTLFLLNGQLAGDPYAMASLSSPYVQTVKLLSPLFAVDRLTAVLQFSLYQALFDMLSVWVTAGVATLATLFIHRLLHGNAPHVVSFEATVLAALCVVVLILGESGFVPLIWPESGTWSLPLFSLFAPMGVSWLMVCGMVAAMLILWSKPAASASRPPALFIVACVLMAMAGLLHPVVPVLALLILGQLALLEPAAFLPRLRQLLILSAIWAAGCLFLVLHFDGGEIAADTLYRLYVEVRHPHHYQPSHYVGSLLTLVPMLAALLVYLVFVAPADRQRRVLFAAGALALVIVPHALQFIFVEWLQIPAAVKFGPSRLTIAFGFIGLVGLALWMLHALLLLRRKYAKKAPLRAVLRLYAAVSESRAAVTACGLGIVICLATLVSGTLTAFEQAQETRIEFALERVARQLNATDHQLINATRYDLAVRELAGLPVYHDDYFPFSAAHIEEWGRRHTVVQALKSCLAARPSGAPCLQLLDKESPILLLSHQPTERAVVHIRMGGGLPDIYITAM